MEHVLIPNSTHPTTETQEKTYLLIGNEVFLKLADQAFVDSWQRLYEACPWATAFQSADYVGAWYEVYRHSYTPVVVVTAKQGELIGLLAMAFDGVSESDTKRAGRTLFGAGKFEAEYQVWIAAEHDGDRFIKSALELLRSHFKNCHILFRYLPAGTPTAWCTNDTQWSRRSVLQAFRRPLLQLNVPESAQLLRIRGQNKTKMNRLQRLGSLSFEVVTDHAEFVAILPELAAQFDFRQGVMFNKNPFSNNPDKINFFSDLFLRGMLHVSILKLNSDIIGSMVAVAGKRWVHLQGINTHSPFYARHSPGILHFYLLANRLLTEPYDVFDLTPGGDYYKERFSTAVDTVYSLAITDSKVFRWKRKLRKVVHKRLQQAGKRPMGVEVDLKRWVYDLKHKLRNIKHAGFGQVWNTQSTKMRELVLQGHLIPEALVPLKKNDLPDLLKAKHGTLSRWEFLEDAMQRFEAGQEVYTWADQDQLYASAWHLPSLGGESVQFTGLTLHAAPTDSTRDFLQSLMHLVLGGKHANTLTPITIKLKRNDTLTLHALQSAGFTTEQV